MSNRHPRLARLGLRTLAVLYFGALLSTVNLLPASAASATPAVDCTGAKAVDSIGYSQNSKPADLAKLAAGQTLAITITPTSGCESATFGAAIYSAPSAKWDPTLAGQQILSHSTAATPASGKAKLSVDVTDCYYQIDIYTGSPVAPLSATKNYSSAGTLIASANGGTSPCVTILATTTTTTAPAQVKAVSVTPTTAAPTTTTTAPAQVKAEAITATPVAATQPAQVEALALTGPDVAPLIGGGAILVGLGGLGELASRRRKARTA